MPALRRGRALCGSCPCATAIRRGRRLRPVFSLTHHRRTHRLRVSTFFSPSTVYILLLIFSTDHLYSREYSRILRIFSPRDRSMDAKNRSKVEVCALSNRSGTTNVPKLKIFVCIDLKPTVEEQKSCFEKLESRPFETPRLQRREYSSRIS